MTESGSGLDRRGEHAALIGLVVQLLIYVALGIMAFWSAPQLRGVLPYHWWVVNLSSWPVSHAIDAVGTMVWIGLPIWVVLYLVCKQLRRVSEESLETEELKQARAAGGDTALFDLESEELHLERNRLQWMVKYLLPAVTIISFVRIIGMNFFAWGWTFDKAFLPASEGGVARSIQPAVMFGFVAGCCLVSFMLSRWILALVRIPAYRILRAGASQMMGITLMTGLLGISQLAGLGKWDWPEPLCAYIVRLVILVMGIEFLANYILDFYRPRTEDDVPRPSFDSRLLGLISKPGGVANSIAEAINYQFGFEVSTTWFYKLLQKWMLPLVLIAAATVLLMTSVVIVDAHEQVVIERFGEPRRGIGDRLKTLEPGIYLKLPYPIDITRRSATASISEIIIGESGESDHDHEEEPIIWTQQHDFVPETMLLVATQQTELASGGGAETDSTSVGSKSVPVSLIMISMPIEYRINDIEAYLYRYEDPVAVMRGLAEQILTEQATGTELDELIGPGRMAFNRRLSELLQKGIERLGLGIELVFVGLRGAHPPSTEGVAAAFQGVVSAQTRAQTQINAARRAQLQVLTTIAGSLQRATALDQAIRVKDHLEADPSADANALADARKRVEVLLLGDEAAGISPVGGRAATILSDARACSSGRISAVQSMVQSFAAEVAAYEASPMLYKARKALLQWRGLDDVRKYLIVGDASNVLFEYNDVAKTGLDTVLTEAIEDEAK